MKRDIVWTTKGKGGQLVRCLPPRGIRDKSLSLGSQ